MADSKPNPPAPAPADTGNVPDVAGDIDFVPVTEPEPPPPGASAPGADFSGPHFHPNSGG